MGRIPYVSLRGGTAEIRPYGERIADVRRSADADIGGVVAAARGQAFNLGGAKTRRLVDHVERAGDGSLPVEHGSRALENFDAGDIERILIAGRHIGWTDIQSIA